MLNLIGNSINKMQNDLDTMGGDAAKYKLWDCFERLIPRNDREIKRRQNLIEGLKRAKAGVCLNFDL